MTRKEFWTRFDANPDSAYDLHREYYAQFVTPEITNALKPLIPRILTSTAPVFNDIPLETWDRLPQFTTVAQHIQRMQGAVAMSDWTCIYKEAARQIYQRSSQ